MCMFFYLCTVYLHVTDRLCLVHVAATCYIRGILQVLLAALCQTMCMHLMTGSYVTSCDSAEYCGHMWRYSCIMWLVSFPCRYTGVDQLQVHPLRFAQPAHNLL